MLSLLLQPAFSPLSPSVDFQGSLHLISNSLLEDVKTDEADFGLGVEIFAKVLNLKLFFFNQNSLHGNLQGSSLFHSIHRFTVDAAARCGV